MMILRVDLVERTLPITPSHPGTVQTD